MADTVVDQAEVLSVRGLVAGYGGRAIVRGIDLGVRRGDILGLLGANGAGKSTLVRALTGQIPLMDGAVSVAGIDLDQKPEAAKANFGLAVEVGDLPAALTGRQYLELVGSIRSCDWDDWPVDGLLDLLTLGQWINMPIAAYSLGTRMKIAICAALLGAPPLLIFDESLNGLDPVAAFRMKRVIADLAASERHGIVLSTHVVETIPVVCNRAIFLAEGGIVESWDAAALAAASKAPGDFERQVMDALSTFAHRDVAA